MVEEASFKGEENEITSTFLPGSPGTTNTVDILLRSRGNTKLDNPRHTWVIHTSSRNIRSNEHRWAVFPSKLVGRAGTFVLIKFGVNLVDGCLCRQSIDQLADEGSGEHGLFGSVEE